MPDFSTSVAALRRWENFSSDTPLPSNLAEWRKTNGQEYMRLSAEDPELFSLLAGKAPAGLVADTLQGKLSPIPKTPEQRANEQQQAEIKELIEANPYQSRNLTQALRLEALDPAAAKVLRKQAGVRSPAERAEQEAQERAQHDSEFNQVIAASQAQQLMQMANSKF